MVVGRTGLGAVLIFVSVDKGLWVPVTMAWPVLRLRMEERPPIWRVAANKLNKQSRTADKGWSSSLVLGEALTTPLRERKNCSEILMGEMVLLETKNPEVKYSTTRLSWGEMFLEEASQIGKGKGTLC